MLEFEFLNARLGAERGYSTDFYMGPRLRREVQPLIL